MTDASSVTVRPRRGGRGRFGTTRVAVSSAANPRRTRRRSLKRCERRFRFRREHDEGRRLSRASAEISKRPPSPAYSAAIVMSASGRGRLSLTWARMTLRTRTHEGVGLALRWFLEPPAQQPVLEIRELDDGSQISVLVIFWF